MAFAFGTWSISKLNGAILYFVSLLYFCIKNPVFSPILASNSSFLYITQENLLGSIKDGDGAPNGYPWFFSGVTKWIIFSLFSYISEQPQVSIWRTILILRLRSACYDTMLFRAMHGKVAVCLVGRLRPPWMGSTHFWGVWMGVEEGMGWTPKEYSLIMRVGLVRQILTDGAAPVGLASFTCRLFTPPAPPYPFNPQPYPFKQRGARRGPSSPTPAERPTPPRPLHHPRCAGLSTGRGGCFRDCWSCYLGSHLVSLHAWIPCKFSG